MLVSVCFFLSGAAALVLQVLWVRMLGHVFGATALAVSSTLTAFMGGLALGAHLAGKRAPRLRRPVLAFAALETLVGLYGLLVPGLLEGLPTVQRLIAPDGGLGFAGYSLLRFAVVALVLALPTTAMGATLPILAEGVVDSGEDMGSKVGELYAANTAGAVVGALLAGFYLIPSFGIEATVRIAAAMDLGVAALVVGIAWLGGDRALIRRRTRSPDDAVLAALDPVPVTPAERGDARVAMLAFALSGAAAMALQVLWSRAVGVVVGASTYAFTLILATFLVGLAGGAAVVTRRIDRVAEPVRWLARVQVAVGALAFVGTLLVDVLPLWIRAAAVARDATLAGLYFANFGVAAAVMLPATFVLGGVMPIVVRVLAPDGAAHAGPVVGRAYTWNTVGAIVGSFAGGFILLPLAGVQRGLAIACAGSLAIGIWLAWTRTPRDRPSLVIGGLAVLGLLLAPSWDVSRWTSGLFRVYLARSVFADGWEASGKLIYHRDGIATTVTVEQAEDRHAVWLKVNGKVDASDIGDMPTQVLSGLLPMLAQPKARRVLVIGYGSGVTPGAVLQAPVEQVTLVELEAAVLEAADRYFAHVNHEPPKDPRYRPVIDDGRNFLLTRDAEWDVIISEPSNPWMSGASSLFTLDFFEIARSRLAEDGVFLQWLQLYELSPDNIHALLRTFRTAFPHVAVFTPNPRSNDTLLLGSRQPIRIRRAAVEAALADPRYRTELERAVVTAPEDLVGLFMAGDEELARFVGPGPLNTDDNARIEFAAPRDLLVFSDADAKLPFVEQVAGRRLELAPKVLVDFGLDRAGPLSLAADRLLRQGRVTDAMAFLEAAEVALSGEVDAEASERVRRVRRIARRISEPDDEPVLVDHPATRDDARYALVARWMLAGDEARALAEADHPDGFEKLSPGHRLLYAYLCSRQERLLDAQYLIDGVMEDETFVARHPAVLYHAARIAADRDRYADAVPLMERYLDARASEALRAATSTAAPE